MLRMPNPQLAADTATIPVTSLVHTIKPDRSGALAHNTASTNVTAPFAKDARSDLNRAALASVRDPCSIADFK
jgi:hypothetical protein